MILAIRNTYFLRSLWIVMAIIILNCSIDAPDKYGDHVPENLSYNDQESFIELFLETILNLGNVIPESDDVDTKQKSNYLKIKFDFYNFNFQTLTLAQNQNLTLSWFYLVKSFSIIFKDITSPPPKL